MEFVASWFQCGAENLDLAVFYNGDENRVNIVVERKNHPNDGDKVSLEFCFKPGFPIMDYDEASFRVTKAEIDDEKKNAQLALQCNKQRLSGAFWSDGTRYATQEEVVLLENSAGIPIACCKMCRHHVGNPGMWARTV